VNLVQADPVNFLIAGSAQKKMSKVCLKIFEQGLVAQLADFTQGLVARTRGFHSGSDESYPDTIKQLAGGNRIP
jgi:hypothetical protein